MRHFTMAAVLILSTPVSAAATITHSYDGHGRLIQIVRTGTVNNGVTTTHGFDKADNRNVKTTTGSTSPPPP